MRKLTQPIVWLGILAAMSVSFLAGVQLAAPQGFFWPSCPFPPQTLASQLDAEQAYAFQDGEPSIRGIIQPGARVRVHLTKGNVVYVTVEAYFDKDLFEQAVGHD